ncbi:GSCOCG00013505001-RA-CDS [Cotesia congregata]|nr:GSCOCG00013505001-RA-CDS [Cotesia congregata]
MLEKLLARMIKNIHVEIKSIHVRYEDHVTFKPHEFAIGLTLNRLALESCNTSWMTTENMKDMYLIPQIFKLLTLDGFSIYLNPSLMQFSKQASSTYLKLFHDSIATTENIPPDYQYLLGPINVKAKLKLNPKPETDGSNYQIPKVWLDLEMEKLRIGLTKRQYATLLQLGEGLDRAKKAAPFRKFRPDVPSYRGHYKEWWQFAYKCVLEEHVVRCRRNWNWAHMKEHRDLCREYAEVYQTKLTSKKPVPAIEERLTHCERHLDLFNLVVIRQQIELEVERLAEKQKSIKAERGWFGFLWGSSQQKEEEELNSAAAIMKKFQDAMTPAEKEKLYRAIDYQENSAPAHYPEHYEMVDMMFYLHGLQIIVSDTDKEEPSVLDVALNGVRSAFKLRPAANSVFVTVSLKEMRMLGVKQADEVPKLVLSEHEHSDVLFSVSYEKNPLDKSCGDRVIVNSKAVHFVYDAQTIIELVKLFKVSNQSALNQIQQAAAERLEGLKEMSALGLEYAIQKHSQLDIQVDLEASQLIVPQNGFYREKESMIVINLGSLKIHTLAKPKDEMSSQTVRQLVSMGKSEEDIMSHLREHSYDRFALKIVNFQALVVTKNEDWRVGLSMSSSPMVILQPTTLEIQFHKCLVTDDPVLPKMRIIGELPSLALCIPGTRLLEAVSIVQSIPFPEDESELQPMPLAKSMSQLSINYVKELAKPVVELTEDVVVQTTDLEAKFVMQEFTLTIFKTEEVQPFIKVEVIINIYLLLWHNYRYYLENKQNFVVTHPDVILINTFHLSTHINFSYILYIYIYVLKVEAEMTTRSYEQDIKLRLGGIQVTQYHKDEKIFMINTPMTSGHQVYLIVLNFMAVNKRSPEFTTRHGSVVNLLRLEFTTLDVLLHQESLISVLKYINEVQDKVTPCSSLESRVATTRDKFSQLSTIQEDTSMFFKDQQKKAKSRSKKVVVECIDLKIKAKFGTISLKIANDKQEISAFLIQGITAGYIMKVSYSQANVNLTSIIIQDLNPKSIYNNIVSVESGESLQVQAVIYNVEAHENKNNMSIKINMGCHRVVFLNDFVSRVMNFLNNFQAAQEAIAEASAAAAEVAKTNIKDAQASATRVELSIKLKAPVIYVPMNSKSEHCLMLDMGELTIYNSLKTLNVEEEEAPVVDEMKIELANLKLSRVRLTENFQMENEILLLQPVSFGLLIKRNLSSWYTSIPDIDMYGRLKQIEVLLSKQDYAMILKVLEENLNESDESPGQKETARERKDIQRTNAREVDVHITERQTSEGQKSARASVKFEFIMDSFVINLFTGGSKLLQSKTSPLHLPENGLAQFGLTHFAVKGTIFADGLLATSILLMNCTLDDKRQNRQGQLTRIMERTNPLTDAEENSKRSMLDVTIRQSVNDIFVDVKVFSFSIIVSLDYLLKIKDFFTIQAVQTQPQVTVQKYTEVKKKAAASNQSMITLNLHIEKPDIILMEDMDNIDCNCIVMNTELVIKVRLIGDHQVINGSVTDLSVLTGIYNPTKRADSAYQVLKPFSVSIAGSTPDNKGLHIDICCTDIHVSVSPGVIEILSRVMRGLTSSDEQADQFIRPDPSHQGLWLITPYDESEYWFLKTEVATEAFEELNFVEDSVVAYKPELAIVSAPNILLTLEAGVGNKTLPMLMLNLGFQSSVNDWSTRTMSIEATISVIMAYYNSRLALWEPLIEPVEVLRQNGERNSSSWELRSKIQFHDLAPDSRGASAVSPSCESEPEDLHQSKMSIDVDSSENLEITVTKTCFEVMEQLSKAFTSAMDAKESVPRLAPYVLKNETGLKLTLDLQASNFVILDKNLQPEGKEDDKYKEVVLETAATIQLAPLVDKRDSVMLEQMRTSVQMNNDYNLMINFDGIDNQLVIPVLRADKRFFSLKYRKESSEEWGIISDVVVENGSTVVALRSVLQVHNHFTETVSVYYMTKRGNEVECGYMVSVEPFVWKDLQKTLSMTKLLKCEPRNKQSKEPFYMQIIFTTVAIACILYNNNNISLLCNFFNWSSKIKNVFNFNNSDKTINSINSTINFKAPLQVVGEIEQVYFENTTRHTMSSTIYNIHLYPSVYLKNFLPIDIVIILPGMVEEKVVKASTTIQLPTVDSNNSNIIIKLISLKRSIVHKIQGHFLIIDIFKDISSSSCYTLQDLSFEYPHQFFYIFIYIIYIYIYICIYEKYIKNACGRDELISLKKSIVKKVQCNLTKVFKRTSIDSGEKREWSSYKSSTTGEIPVEVIINQRRLSYLRTLAAIPESRLYIIFVIYIYIYICITFNSSNSSSLLRRKKNKNKNMFAYAVSLALESFRYVNAFSRDKVLTDKCTSLINGGKTKPTPVIACTHPDITLIETFHLSTHINFSYINIYYIYVYMNNISKCMWRCFPKVSKNLDQISKFIVEEEIFYVSFLDGFQRVLLFTNNLKIAEDCQLVGDLEVIDQEVTLNIHGVGLSLVNNLTRAELLYLRIASSGIIWETRKTIGSRWKPLTSTEVLVIEEGYQKYLREVQLGTEPPYRVMLEPKLMVDFQNMEMLRPHRRYMRRTFQTGLWIQYRSSAHQVQLHAKINRLQIDNQLAECVFPVILAPVPPPKSVANSFLIQEFHVKVDIGFINALMTFFEANEVNDAEETRLFAVDMKLVDEPLMYHVAMITTAEQKNFFDLLHFSPLKIHVSFSMTGGGGGPSAVPQFLNVLLQGIGVTLTDINDIVFKFGYFERDYVFMTNNQLINEATSHYTGQGIKQLYVLVLGLDVIGNPYGLVVGAMKGVEDLFYEPFQGAIQGPGEFAEGLLLGVRSMLGHTVGGMAGAVSKITGAMGKGLAALTFDKDYQRKRQEGLNKQPANLQEGLARSGKGLVMGFVDGVTGVVMKPISGAKEEGVEGFFKGFGKGVVGLVTRPTAGAIDFASGSFGAVRRATELSEEVKRVRPPRFLRPDCLVRPFIHAEAEGNKILFDLEKGKYANTDVYFHHTFVGKDVLLMTDKRIAYIEHSDLFGGWKVQWGYTWQEITEPRIIEKGVQISVKEARKKKLGGLFGSDAAGKIILISDLAVKHQVFNIIRDKIEKIES